MRYWAMMFQSFTEGHSLADKATNSILSLGVVTGARQLLLGDDQPIIYNRTFVIGNRATNSILSLGVVTGARQLLLGEDAPTIDNWTFRCSRIIN
jgi:hypothetical protein